MTISEAPRLKRFRFPVLVHGARVISADELIARRVTLADGQTVESWAGQVVFRYLDIEAESLHAAIAIYRQRCAEEML